MNHPVKFFLLKKSSGTEIQVPRPQHITEPPETVQFGNNLYKFDRIGRDWEYRQIVGVDIDSDWLD